ncbi:MAG TPA: hemolysin family protein [Jiangellales bacterium]|nr:hemolysin family protein [Jiangellales bacterium]
MTEILLLLLAVVLIAANALFVAAEFSLVTVDRALVRRKAAAGDPRAAGVDKALSSLSTQLSGAQLGITITSLLVGYLAEPAVARLLEPVVGAAVGEAAALPVAMVLALLLASSVQMVVGELFPKNYAIARPYPTAVVVSPFQRAFTVAAGPLIHLLNGTANRVLRRLGVEPQEELAAGRPAHELVALVRRSAELGSVDAPTARLMQRAVGFAQHNAADAMTPRVRMVVVRPSASVTDALRLARRTGFSRLPIMERGADEVLGVVHVKAALAVPRERRDRSRALSIATPPLYVPEAMDLDRLLAELRRGVDRLAVVVDEYGGIAGVVTMEDLVEELVGEVHDEHDRSRHVPARRLPDGSWSVSGLIRPDELLDAVGVEVPESDEYDTLAGFLADRLDAVPEVGDEVVHEGWRFVVRRRDGLRVDRIVLEPTHESVDRDVPGLAADSEGVAR